MSSPYPDFAVYVNGVVDTNPREAFTLIMQDSMHSVAQVHLLYQIPVRNGKQVASPHFQFWPKNSLIHVTYGMSGVLAGMSNFYGYNLGVQSQQNYKDPRGTAFLRVTYLITGTSLPMQQHRSEAYYKVTPSFIATERAKANGFRAVVDPYPQVMDYYAQDQKSDFTMLNELAARIGYRFWVNGTDLYFMNPTHMVSINNTIEAFQLNADPSTLSSIRSFKMTQGETVNDGGLAAVRAMTVLNPHTAALSRATNAYLREGAFTKAGGPKTRVSIEGSPYVADSYAEALALMAGQTAANRHWTTAEAVTNGRPAVTPGCAVNMYGDGMMPQNSGMWMVTSATHSIIRNVKSPTLSTYTMDLRLGRDQVDSAYFSVPPAWSQALKSVAMTAQGDTWRASLIGSPS
jgi:phage protein D